MFAEIVLPIPIKKKFLYIIPDELKQVILPGVRVNVPFSNRTEKGYVISIKDTITENIPVSSLKKIDSVIDKAPVITDELFKLANWMSDFYLCSTGEILNCILPLEVYSKKVESEFLVKNLQESPNLIKKNNNKPEVYVACNLQRIKLVNIYMKLIKEHIEPGECIFIVPELQIIPELLQNLNHIISKDKIGLWHNKISRKIKYQNWLLALSGKLKIMFGTRSTIFAPFKNLKLIIIDTETNESYKNIQKPEYDTVDVAIKRAELTGAKVVLGYKIPSLTIYYNLKIKKYKYLEYSD